MDVNGHPRRYPFRGADDMVTARVATRVTRTSGRATDSCPARLPYSFRVARVTSSVTLSSRGFSSQLLNAFSQGTSTQTHTHTHTHTQKASTQYIITAHSSRVSHRTTTVKKQACSTSAVEPHAQADENHTNRHKKTTPPSLSPPTLYSCDLGSARFSSRT